MTILDRFRLTDRVVVVSGASSGLGVAFARCLAEAGAHVVLGARRVEGLEATAELVRAMGRTAVVVPTDVTDPEACRRLATAAAERFGRIDGLVNNAGVATARPASRETEDEFRAVLDVNLEGSYWLARACLPHMPPGSAVVNIGSVLGARHAGLPQAAYASSKAAVVALSRDLAGQWTDRKGIRVNTLVPGFFESEMTDQYEPAYLEGQVARTSMRRLGDADELAAALLFLLSDASSYVTGTSLVVDGGYLSA